MLRFRFRIALLKGIAAVFGLLFTAPGTGLAQAAPAALKVAIVGLVHVRVDALLASLPKRGDVQLVGIAEPDGALAAKYAEKYNLPKKLFYPQLEALLEAQRPGALLVYTSTAEHRAAIETAAGHGIAVVVEKPLTLSLADALAIRKAAREHKIQVLVDYETTWQASSRAAYEEAESGRLGAIRRVVFSAGYQGPDGAGAGPEYARLAADPAKSGAGALYDVGCYGADLMTWLMHGEAPLTVTAVSGSDRPENYANGYDDATVVLAYPHAQAVIQASWNWPFPRKDMEIYGATGYAATAGPEWVRIRHEHDKIERVSTAPQLTPPLDDPLSYLEDTLSEQINPLASPSGLDTNVVVMQILDAARESVRTGQSVKLAKLDE
jgi:predicted dehydrogenase